ncbi:hypothetical protein H8K33_15385 [Undibacterium amnicola]|uniref:Uncharacterized protein n=1 Tax=Undibacterium amnicola TaxID=1834038 RepID=A0ABR6XTV7_9BURK|nr:hypothetical protein [Undibacterium amnicola]MBC3832892.1 hypothetical protein [Undibacterium amnicola]
MATSRHKWAMICYLLALLVSVGNMLAIFYIHRVPLFTGRGLGSFVVLWFVLYAVPSTGIWFVGSLFEKQRKWTMAYWTSIGLMMLIMLIVPMKFYID